MTKRTILVTGSAGFIGYHLANRLVKEGHRVIGIDNLNDYYNPQLKIDRLVNAGFVANEVAGLEECHSTKHGKYLSFKRIDLVDQVAINELFDNYKFDVVVNLAAQAGVRYSISNPQAYIDSNITGFTNILEACRRNEVSHLVYASSSSVYGLNKQVPFKETDAVEQPASLYAATKRSNELMAHVYGHLYGLPTTGLRFFTVYGPWGRPDMAYSLFSDAILNDRPIEVFNNGQMSRDFTYIDDIVEGLCRVTLDKRPAQTAVPASVYNIGAGQPVNLMSFIEAMEVALGKVAQKDFLPMQPGDVEQTFADTTALQSAYSYLPNADFQHGIQAFVDWYKSYYNL